MAMLFPSLISADLLNLECVIKQLDPIVPGYHLDIMDHHFVPNLTWGPMFIHAIAKATNKILWVHLMVDNPTIWIEELNLPGGSILSIHIETISDTSQIIKLIQEKKLKVSIAISPKTPINEFFSLLPMIDQALIMSVEPGWSGQSFLTPSIEKLETLVDYRRSKNLKFRIAMDGGITEKNIKELAQKGVDDFAVASSIFGKPDPVAAAKELTQLIA